MGEARARAPGKCSSGKPLQRRRHSTVLQGKPSRARRNARAEREEWRDA